MTQNRIFFIMAGISGFLAVALGAYGSHVLKMQADENVLRSFDIAGKYHFYHTIALVAVGSAVRSKTGYLAGWLMAAGIVLFSGGIYLAILGHMPGFTKVTPFGGMAFMAGWLAFALAVYRDRK